MRRNNKILIPIIILLLAVTIAVVVVLVILSKNQKGPVTTNEVANTVANSVPTPAATTKPEEKIDLSNVDKIYQDIAIAFADGLSSEKKMDTFKEKYFDPIAFVAYSKMDNIEDFLTLYEAVEETETDKISTALTEISVSSLNFSRYETITCSAPPVESSGMISRTLIAIIAVPFPNLEIPAIDKQYSRYEEEGESSDIGLRKQKHLQCRAVSYKSDERYSKCFFCK